MDQLPARARLHRHGQPPPPLPYVVVIDEMRMLDDATTPHAGLRDHQRAALAELLRAGRKSNVHIEGPLHWQQPRTPTEMLGPQPDRAPDPNDPETRGVDPDLAHDRAVEDHL